MKVYFIGISLIVLFWACKSEQNKLMFNIYGNGFRTNSFEDFKNIWSGIVYFEKVNISDTGGFANFPLSLGDNEFVVSTNNGYITYFNERSLVWEIPLDLGEYLVTSFAADRHKNIYFITNYLRLYSISKNGKKNWVITIEDSSKSISTLLTSEDALYFSTSSNTLFKYSFDGKLLWKKKFSLSILHTFTLFKEGIVLNLSHYEYGKTDTLVYINKNGNEKWKFFSQNVRILKNPVVFQNRIFVYGVETVLEKDKGVLFSIDELGKLLWKKEFQSIPRFLSVSKNQELYLILYSIGVGQIMSELQKIDFNGITLDKQFIASNFYTPFFIGKKKLFNLGYKDGKPMLIFFGKDLVLMKHFDLSNAPVLLIMPVILDNGTIIYLSANSATLIRIDENPILKFLPW